MLLPLLSLAFILTWTIIAFLGLPGAAPTERIEQMRQQIIAWYRQPTDPVRMAAYAALGLSVLIGIVGYFNLLPLPQKLIDDFYANGAAELASIAITVLIIDRLGEWRAQQRDNAQEKRTLVEQLSSPSNQFALEALRIIRARRWMRDGTLRKVDLVAADLSNGHLYGANLSGARLYRTRLEKANLRRANLTYCDMREAIMRQTNLTRANLYGADLAAADLKFAIYDYETNWPKHFDFKRCGAIGPNAELEGVDLSGVKLRIIDLSGADLSGADLSGAYFEETSAVDPDIFSETNSRYQAGLRKANLRSANFSGVVLYEVQYSTTTQWPESFDPIAHGAVLIDNHG